MTRVGNYQMTKTTEGYVLTTLTGEQVGTFPTARKASDHAVALIAKAYKARQSA